RWQRGVSAPPSSKGWLHSPYLAAPVRTCPVGLTRSIDVSAEATAGISANASEAARTTPRRRRPTIPSPECEVNDTRYVLGVTPRMLLIGCSTRQRSQPLRVRAGAS